jgi:hypothetical protein
MYRWNAVLQYNPGTWDAGFGEYVFTVIIIIM